MRCTFRHDLLNIRHALLTRARIFDRQDTLKILKVTLSWSEDKEAVLYYWHLLCSPKKITDSAAASRYWA